MIGTNCLEMSTRTTATHLVCGECGASHGLDYRWGHCECGKCLDVVYDYEKAADLIHSIPLSDRPKNIWRFEEMLPIQGYESRNRVGDDIGWTPLVHAKRLGGELGLTNLYLKNDSVSQPTFSYKDRVVAMAVGRALDIDAKQIACVSTGNVGNAVAAMAARAGLQSIVFYPEDMERTKGLISAGYGAYVVEVAANYDVVNGLCKEIARETGLAFANISLRPYYSEGAKTVAYEIVEQMHWTSPDHILLPAAGGTLSSRVYKGLQELEAVGLARTIHTKIHIAQAEGCAPIARAIRRAEPIERVTPMTAAYSLAIGNPGDGGMVVEAVLESRGSTATPSDPQILEAIDLLARTEGILTEPAGGATVAGLVQLVDVGTFALDEIVVAVITGNGLKTIADYGKKSWDTVIPHLRQMAMQIEGAKWDRA